MRNTIIALLYSSILASPVSAADGINEYKTLIENIVSTSSKEDVKVRLSYLVNNNPSDKAIILEIISVSYPEFFENYYPELRTQASAGFNSVSLIGIGAGVLAIAALSGGGKKDNSGGNLPPVDEPNLEPDPLPPSGNSYVTEEFQRNYGLSLIGVQDLYLNDGVSGEGVLISVIDSGLEKYHPDLVDNVDFNNSYSFATDSNDTIDYTGHGTHVAGIIAGMKNDSGVHGISYNSKIMGVQAIVNTADDGWWYDRHIDPITNKDLADSFKISLDAGAKIINNSWGFDNSYISDFNNRTEIENFLGVDMTSMLSDLSKSDSIAVFSAGNNANSNVGVMGGLPQYFSELNGHIVVVGSVDENKSISSFSNRCGVSAEWCLVAPGENIYSTLSSYYYGENAYGTMTGTSMAAPFVSGSIALMMEKFPELGSAEVLNILFDTADDLGESGTDSIYGRGMLNLGESLRPQGGVSFHTSNVVSGDSYSVNETRFFSNGIIGIAEGLSNQSIMVTDSYNRGYYISADKFAYEANSKNYFGLNGEEYQLTNNISWYEGVLKTQSNQENNTIGMFYNSYEAEILNDVNGIRFNNLYDGIFSMQGSYGFGEQGNIIKVNNYLSFNNMDLDFEVGRLQENGSILGSFGVGGLSTADVDSETKFLKVTTGFNINGDDRFILSGTLGKTDFSGASLISSNREIETQSYNFGYEKNGVFSSDDALSFMVSKPLYVSNGSIKIDLPKGRGISQDNVSSDAIIRDNVIIDLENSSDVQIGIDYNYPIDNKSKLRISSYLYNGALEGSFGINWRF